MSSSDQTNYDPEKVYCPECKGPAEPGSFNRISSTHVEYRCAAGHGYFGVRDFAQEALADLELLSEGDPMAFDDEWGYSNDQLLQLGIGYGIPGPLSDEQVRRE